MYRRLPPSKSAVSGRTLRLAPLKKHPPAPRPFTQNSQSLLVSSVGARPQLPFLHPVAGGRALPVRVPKTSAQYQLSRLISTERKLYLKDHIWKGAKYTVYGWAGLILLAIMAFGFQEEAAERRFPSPHEWSFRTRIAYRAAKLAENADTDGTGLVDWSYVGRTYNWLLERLENPTIDGQDLPPILQDEGDIYVTGLGKSGLDISSRSEPWRRGYYTCLMGAAKAAENRDGWLLDKTRGFVFPPEVVIGPSNPRPKPVPYRAQSAPLEENCVPCFEPAEKYYTKILTTHGFNSRQRLDAALAYADWLDFKGLPATAEDIYDWGLDIATGSLPEGVNNVIDINTGVINSSATYVSSNVLRATTSLAIHHAHHNNLAAALPIFVSVLRARRELLDPEPTSIKSSKSRDQFSPVKLLSYLYSLIQTPPYPPAPATGDEVPLRTSTAICEEAAVMSHIGEILFASSDTSSSANWPSSTPIKIRVPPNAIAAQSENQQSGLSWTREAVDLAEETLMSADENDTEARDKCSECLTAGMDNWSTMVAKMFKDERRKKPAAQQKTGSWLWGSGSEVDAQPRWERESQLVEERRARVRRLLNQEADRRESALGFFT